MYLFFDTETSGLPKNFDADIHDVDNWPRIVQIAWQHYDEHRNKLAEHSYIIKPDGFVIDEESIKIHKITQERAEKEGVPIRYALQMFEATLSQTSILVAHNIPFDAAVVGSELIRANAEKVYDKMSKIRKICTMRASVQFCKLPGKYGYKWPKLSELFEKLNPGEPISNDLHDASVDVSVMVDCFFKLREQKII